MLHLFIHCIFGNSEYIIRFSSSVFYLKAPENVMTFLFILKPFMNFIKHSLRTRITEFHPPPLLFLSEIEKY